MAASGQAKTVQVGVGVLICKGDRVLVGRRCSFIDMGSAVLHAGAQLIWLICIEECFCRLSKHGHGEWALPGGRVRGYHRNHIFAV